MKKRILFILLAVVLAVSLGLIGCGEQEEEEEEPETITIGFNHIWPATAFQQVEQFTRYFEMVEEETNGAYELEIEWYPVGTLFGGADIFDGVAEGSVDAGCSVFAYTPGKFPTMLALSQCGVAPPASGQAGSMTVWEFYQEYPDELEDVKVLYLFNTPPGWLHSVEQIDELAEFQGADIRCTGATATGVEVLGGVPHAMAQGDTYAAVKAGDVVGSIAPAEVLVSYTQHEVFDYSTAVPFMYSASFFVIINQDFWDALPSDLQDAFDAVTEDAVEQAGQLWQYFEDEYIDECTTDYGHTFLELDPAEEDEWIALLADIGADYAADLDALGLDGSAIVAEAGDIAAANNAKTWPEWTP